MTDVDFLLNRAGLTWQQVDRLAGFKLSRTLPLGVEGLDEAKRQRLRYLVDQLTTAFAERGAVTLDARRLALLDSSHGMSLFHSLLPASHQRLQFSRLSERDDEHLPSARDV